MIPEYKIEIAAAKYASGSGTGQRIADLSGGFIDGVEWSLNEIQPFRDKFKKLIEFYDNHNGTPCEQIRHRDEVQHLKDQITACNKILNSINGHLNSRLNEGVKTNDMFHNMIKKILTTKTL